MEHQFTILREQLYQERIRQNEMHLNDVRNGRSQAYLEPLKQLTEVMQNRIEVATVLKRFRLENINHKFLAEEQAARQHFEVKIKKIFAEISSFFSNYSTKNCFFLVSFAVHRVKKSWQKISFMRN